MAERRGRSPGTPRRSRRYRWSPDGRTIAFTAADPKDEAQTEREKAGYDEVVVNTDFEWAKLWTVDVESGRETQLVTDDITIEEFAWSPDGLRLAVRVRPTTLLDLSRRSEIHVMPSAGGPMTRLTDNDTMETTLVWARDGQAIYYTASDEARFVNAESRLFRIDVGTRTIRRLLSDYRYGISNPRLLPDGRMLFVGGVRASQRLSALDLSTGVITELLAG